MIIRMNNTCNSSCLFPSFQHFKTPLASLTFIPSLGETKILEKKSTKLKIVEETNNKKIKRKGKNEKEKKEIKNEKFHLAFSKTSWWYLLLSCLCQIMFAIIQKGDACLRPPYLFPFLGNFFLPWQPNFTFPFT